jgi:formamidopyrimidine-DNA glycosylase
MPELPDITAYISALNPRIVGQRIERVRLASPFLLRTVQPPVTDVAGRTVRALRRIGKRIAIGVDGDLWLVLHLMIAGRLHWRPSGAKLSGRQNLAAFDFSSGALVLTEAGTKRRASLYIVAGEEDISSLARKAYAPSTLEGSRSSRAILLRFATHSRKKTARLRELLPILAW